MSSVSELTGEIREFVRERDWQQFHTTRNLLLALVGEVGELAAELQWVPDSEVDGYLSRNDNREKFESEIADVATYLLRLCDVAGVDLSAVVRRKLEVNRVRYPADKARGVATKYSDLDSQ
ncbi:MAG: nucleotide pyrophosphohydrolase [Planctomycetes bacterium]|nr:nucleotide pyrophosphohydrolase [Planctomycetota bacterium]